MHTPQMTRTTTIAAVIAALAALAAPAAATGLRAGPPELISETATGTAGNGVSGVAGLAVSGRDSVAFSSLATNLLTPDANPVSTDQTAVPEIYVSRPRRGTTVLASATDTGEMANADSTRPSLSLDGRSVAFLSAATNLDPTGSDTQQIDAYVKDLRTGGLIRASSSGEGERANGPTSDVALSGDGQEVAFVTTATNLDSRDTDTAQDVYVKNLATGAVTLASIAPDGNKPAGTGVRGISLSADGRWLAFSTDAALDARGTEYRSQVYLKDLETGDLTLVSATAEGTIGDAPSTDPVLSADGGVVTFRSFADNLDPLDQSQDSDIYRKDLSTGALSLVSTNAAGEKGNASSSMPTMSADGSIVAFASYATNLQNEEPAPPANLDVFVKILATGQVVDVSRYAGSELLGAVSVYPALQPSGRTVVFATNNTFTPADTNGIADVYRSRLRCVFR